MKITPEKITAPFYKLFGNSFLKFSVLMAIGLLLSWNKFMYEAYPFSAWLMLLICVFFIIVLFTSKVIITKDEIFFKSILKTVTMRTNTVETTGFIRQSMKPVGGTYKEVSGAKRVGLFNFRLFYLSTDIDFEPKYIKNITPSLIYFECNLKESIAILKLIKTGPMPKRAYEYMDIDTLDTSPSEA